MEVERDTVVTAIVDHQHDVGLSNVLEVRTDITFVALFITVKVDSFR